MNFEILPLLCYGAIGLASVLMSYEAYADYQATSNKWARTTMIFCIQSVLLSFILAIKHL